MPSPLAAVPVNIAGAVPSHMVCEVPMTPGVKFTTVTLTEFVSSVQRLPSSVEVTKRLNHVSWVRLTEV